MAAFLPCKQICEAWLTSSRQKCRPAVFHPRTFVISSRATHSCWAALIELTSCIISNSHFMLDKRLVDCQPRAKVSMQLLSNCSGCMCSRIHIYCLQASFSDQSEWYSLNNSMHTCVHYSMGASAGQVLLLTRAKAQPPVSLSVPTFTPISTARALCNSAF